MDNRAVEYDKSGQYCHNLVCTLDSQEPVQYQLNLLIKHKPDFLVPLYWRIREDKLQLCQDVTGLSSLQNFLQSECQNNCPEPKTASRLIKIVEQIREHLNTAADMLLPANQFSLDPDLIFLNDRFDVKLVFWPVTCPDSDSTTVEKNIKSICESCGIEYTDTNNSVPSFESAVEKSGSGLLQKLKNLPSAVLILHMALPLLIFVHIISGQHLVTTRLAGLVFILFLVSYDIRLLLKFMSADSLKKYKNIFAAFLTEIGLASFREQDTGKQQTAVVPQDPANFRIALLSENTADSETEGIRAFILVTEFLIGRDMKKVDLCLADSSIGRIHARIIRRAGTFFIVDQGSKNGTFLNEKRLEKFVETQIPDDCHLQFAQRKFHFQADSD